MKINFTKQLWKKNSAAGTYLQFGLLALLLVLMAVFNARAQTYNPMRYWTFNGANATTDSMGIANLNFTTYNSQYTVGSNGQVGKYISLNTTTNLVTGGNVNLTNSITIEFLIKPGYEFNTSNLLQRGDGAFSVRFEYPKLVFSTSYKSASGSTIDDKMEIELDGVGRKSYGYYVDNNWHHMVFKLDGTTGLKQIWVDGQMPAGFSKSITPGNFQNTGTTTFFLNHSISYVKYNGSIDELAIYDKAIPDALIYKHYLGIQSGQPYNFTNNYGGTIPPASPTTAPIDINEYAPGHPTVTMPAVEQLNSFPVPRYKPGNTLLKNFNWMDPRYMGGLFQPGVTTLQAVVNSTNIQNELVKNFNFYLNLATGNSQFDTAWIGLANRNPSYKLSLITFRAQPTSDLLDQTKPSNHYLQNASGQFLDASGNVTSNKIWRPTAPTSSYVADGNDILAGINNLYTRLTRSLDFINENGEIFPYPKEAAMVKDPVVTAAKNASGLDWQTFLAGKFKENEIQSYRDVFMAHPRLTNTKFTEFSIDGYPPVYGFKYSEARKVNTPINNQYYPTSSFYPRWPYNWRYWATAWHGWQWIVESRVNELALGDRLHSPFVAAGWDANEELNIRPAQWLGLLKALGMSGAEFYYACFFSIGAPWPDSKNWIWQSVMPSYAQAITSRYEDFLRNGELMNGDVPNSYSSPTAPGYSFWAGDLRKLVVVRKHNQVNKYAITGTLQPNSNMTGNAENEGIAKITLDGQTIMFKVRRQGSTYIYDKSNPSAPVFYQLDGWHEATHPARWSKDFQIEAELYDNTNSQIQIKTAVPAGTPAGDFTNATSYVAWPDNTPNPTPVEFTFTPRSVANNELYVWIRARSRGGATTNMNVQVGSNPAKTIGCISDTAWTWYRYDACTQQPILIQGINIQSHTLRITPGTDKLEIDQILLTISSTLILNPAPPSCGSATATITTSGNTTFCTGGNVTLTSSSGATYQWFPGGQTTQSITVNASGSYYVNVGNGSGCSSVANPVTVTVNPAPTATITPNGSTTICQGQSVVLNAPAGMTSYVWSPGGQTTSSITTGIAGNYNVTITNANGCSAVSAPVAVTVGQTPTATITAGGSTSLCQGGSVTLTASTGNNYLWFPGGQTTPSITVSNAGSYTVQITNSPGCSATSAATNVTVSGPVNATITPSGPTALQPGQTVTLTASGGTSYIWAPDGQTTSSIVVSTAGTYSVTAVNAAGCTATSSPVNVTYVNGPPATITSSNGTGMLCPGTNMTLTASTGSSYLWTPGGQTTQAITINSDGVYSVAVTDGNGVTTSANITISYNLQPDPPAVLSTYIPNSSYQLSAYEPTAHWYIWSTGENTASITVNTPATFTVRAVNALGCKSALQTVTVSSLSSQPCGTPNMLYHYGITKNEAMLTWNPAVTADSFRIEYSQISTSSNYSIVVPGNQNNALLENLVEGETYKWSVTALCASGQAGSAILQFNTLSGPMVCGSTPQYLSTDVVNATMAKLSWFDTQADRFVIRYRQVGTIPWQYKRVYGSLTNGEVHQLIPGTNYEWSVKSLCGTNISLYSPSNYFTTPMACPGVGAVSVTDVSFNKVLLSWTPSTGADSVMIRYAVIGTTNYKTYKIPANPDPGTIWIKNLQPETTYKAWVATKCVYGSTSMWGAGVTFTTTADPNPRYAPEAGSIHLNAYPNPTKFHINYVFESKDDKPYSVKVCDMAGRELFSEVRTANEGLTGEEVDLPGFANGMYMLIVQKGPAVGRFKFNIQQ